MSKPSRWLGLAEKLFSSTVAGDARVGASDPFAAQTGLDHSSGQDYSAGPELIVDGLPWDRQPPRFFPSDVGRIFGLVGDGVLARGLSLRVELVSEPNNPQVRLYVNRLDAPAPMMERFLAASPFYGIIITSSMPIDLRMRASLLVEHIGLSIQSSGIRAVEDAVFLVSRISLEQRTLPITDSFP